MVGSGYCDYACLRWTKGRTPGVIKPVLLVEFAVSWTTPESEIAQLTEADASLNRDSWYNGKIRFIGFDLGIDARLEPYKIKRMNREVIKRKRGKDEIIGEKKGS